MFNFWFEVTTKLILVFYLAIDSLNIALVTCSIASDVL